MATNTPLLQSMINAVYTETNRPDLVPDTLQAVLEATLTAHTLDNFPRDILESQVVFDNSQYIQSLDSTVIPYYRQLAYLRKWDPGYNSYQLNPTILPPIMNIAGQPNPVYPTQGLADFRIIETDEYLDDYWGGERLNVAYQAGTAIQMKSATAFQYARIGWYALPKLAVDQYDSWVASLYPYVIIYKAAMTIFSNTGDLDSLQVISNPNTGKWTNSTATGVHDTFIKANLMARGR